MEPFKGDSETRRHNSHIHIYARTYLVSEPNFSLNVHFDSDEYFHVVVHSLFFSALMIILHEPHQSNICHFLS